MPAKSRSELPWRARVVREPGGEPLKKASIEPIGHDQEESGNYTAASDR
jgi:hypothetical protein